MARTLTAYAAIQTDSAQMPRGGRRTRNTLGLTDREQHIVVLAADGRSDVEIAEQLGIGRGSVLTYWRRIRLKLKANNRTAAVVQYMLAMQERMLTPLLSLHNLAAEALHGGIRSEAMERFAVAVERRFPHDALAIVSASGHLWYVNEMAVEKMGVNAQEALGRHCRDFVPPGSEDRLTEVLGKRERGNSGMESLLMVGPDGVQRSIITMAAPVFDDTDAYCGILVVFDTVL